MAEAMIHAMTVKGVQKSEDIIVFDVEHDRLEYLRSKYSVKIAKHIDETVMESQAIVLAVKPQNVDTVSEMLTVSPSNEQLLLSIVAGCTIDKLKSKFGTKTVVRSMPNTPAMVLEGMTVWTATHDSPKEVVDMARAFLSSIGDQIEVSDESYLDMATAVSGSGPAVSTCI